MPKATDTREQAGVGADVRRQNFPFPLGLFWLGTQQQSQDHSLKPSTGAQVLLAVLAGHLHSRRLGRVMPSIPPRAPKQENKA